MSYTLRLTPDAVKDIKRHKKSGDRKLLQKMADILDELR
jgi:toxin YoeB